MLVSQSINQDISLIDRKSTQLEKKGANITNIRSQGKKLNEARNISLQYGIDGVRGIPPCKD